MNFVIVILILSFILVNLGNFIDITQKPKKSDILVSLGGPNGIRLEKTLDLYNKDYSNSKKIIYTGSDYINSSYSKSLSKKRYLLEHGVDDKNIVYIDGSIITNTMEEIYFVKSYLDKYHLKSVLFVSHPQHSRRIQLLANWIAKYKEDGIKISIVSCNAPSWNKAKYYQSKSTFIATVSEAIKIVYNLLKYSPPFFQFTDLNKKMNTIWHIKLEQF